MGVGGVLIVQRMILVIYRAFRYDAERGESNNDYYFDRGVMGY